MGPEPGNSFSWFWLLELNDLGDRREGYFEGRVLFYDSVFESIQLVRKLEAGIVGLKIREGPVTLYEVFLYAGDAPFLRLRQWIDRNINTPPRRHSQTASLLGHGHWPLTLESVFAKM